MAKVKKKKRKRKNRRKTYIKIENIVTRLHLPFIVLKIYLIPIAKIALVAWLMITGQLIVCCALYVLFGLSNIYKHMNNVDLSDHTATRLFVCFLLWPALDIYTFIPPKDIDF